MIPLKNPLCKLLKNAIKDLHFHMHCLADNINKAEYEETLDKVENLINTQFDLIESIDIYIDIKYDGIELKGSPEQKHQKMCEILALAKLDYLQKMLQRNLNNAQLYHNDIQLIKPKRKLSRSC